MNYSSFKNNPRYQRALQRIAAIPPEQQAVLRSRYGDLDAYFAAEDAKKKLASEEYTANLKYAKSSLGLRRRAQDINIGLRKKGLDFQGKQDLLSSGVGLIQAGVAGKMGRETDAVKIAMAKRILGLGV